MYVPFMHMGTYRVRFVRHCTNGAAARCTAISLVELVRGSIRVGRVLGDLVGDVCISISMMLNQ